MFGLKEINIRKSEFRAWSKQFLKGVLARLQVDCTGSVIDEFKAGSTDAIRFILKQFENFTIFTGPSINK